MQYHTLHQAIQKITERSLKRADDEHYGFGIQLQTGELYFTFQRRDGAYYQELRDAELMYGSMEGVQVGRLDYEALLPSELSAEEKNMARSVLDFLLEAGIAKEAAEVYVDINNTPEFAREKSVYEEVIGRYQGGPQVVITSALHNLNTKQIMELAQQQQALKDSEHLVMAVARVENAGMLEGGAFYAVRGMRPGRAESFTVEAVFSGEFGARKFAEAVEQVGIVADIRPFGEESAYSAAELSVPPKQQFATRMTAALALALEPVQEKRASLLSGIATQLGLQVSGGEGGVSGRAGHVHNAVLLEALLDGFQNRVIVVEPEKDGLSVKADYPQIVAKRLEQFQLKVKQEQGEKGAVIVKTTEDAATTRDKLMAQLVLQQAMPPKDFMQLLANTMQVEGMEFTETHRSRAVQRSSGSSAKSV